MRSRASSLLLPIGVLMGALGCGELDHSDYIDSRATSECKQYRACAEGYYESTFKDFDDCVDARGDFLDKRDDDLPRSCDYDGAEARRCVSRIDSMGCEEFAEEASGNACDLVWSCND